MSIKAIIFDLGGVLVRTEDQSARDRLAARLGITPAALAEVFFESETAARATTGLVSTSEHKQSLERALRLAPGELDEVWEAFWDGDRLDTLLVDTLRSLRSRYKTALLSNAWDNLRHVITQNWKIDDAFDVMVISAEEGMAKPDPRIYHLVLERLGVQPGEAVFVDDFVRNIVAAREVGLHAVHFQNQQQALAGLQEVLDAQG